MDFSTCISIETVSLSMKYAMFDVARTEKSYQSIPVFTTVKKMDVSFSRVERAILRMVCACVAWRKNIADVSSQVSALLNGCDFVFGTIERNLVLRLMCIAVFSGKFLSSWRMDYSIRCAHTHTFNNIQQHPNYSNQFEKCRFYFEKHRKESAKWNTRVHLLFSKCRLNDGYQLEEYECKLIEIRFKS